MRFLPWKKGPVIVAVEWFIAEPVLVEEEEDETVDWPNIRFAKEKKDEEGDEEEDEVEEDIIGEDWIVCCIEWCWDDWRHWIIFWYKASKCLIADNWRVSARKWPLLIWDSYPCKGDKEDEQKKKEEQRNKRIGWFKQWNLSRQVTSIWLSEL